MKPKLPLLVKLVAGLYLLQGIVNGGLALASLIELLTNIDVAPGHPEGLIGIAFIVVLLGFCGLLTSTGWFLLQGKRPALFGAIVVSSLEMGFYGMLAFAGWAAALIGWDDTTAMWAGLAGVSLHLGILLYLTFSKSVRDAFGR